MRTDPTPPPASPIVVAVLTAALTTLVTGLATWAVDELRWRYGWSQPPEKKKPDPGGST